MYGGAIAFDSPPGFFLAGGSGPGYQGFIEQVLCGDAGRLVVVICKSGLIVILKVLVTLAPAAS